MIRKQFDENVALERLASRPHNEKPRFDWGSRLTQTPDLHPELKIQSGAHQKEFSLEEVAITVGNALTDLLLSREEEDIYNEKNQDFVACIAQSVARDINMQLKDGRAPVISEYDVHASIEKVLIEHNAHDVAKSLWVQHTRDNHGLPFSSDARVVNARVIRRNNQVVPWQENKIEIAVRKAFLSLQMDSAAAVDIALSVSERVQKLGQAFVHIETVQDLVQEELMRQGHYKVAEAYILYRAHRMMQREQEGEEAPLSDERQESMIMVSDAEGRSILWDGSELRLRIEYAMIGLDLVLSQDEVESELRRSLYPEMTQEDLKKTIILNAKALIEKDADFAKFAGRILLSYIYEEVLGWSIVQDGIKKLKEFHANYFIQYVKCAVEIERLSPRLLEYDLARLGAALDPSADLDFDYLGIQTLYDRYLIVDKTAKKHRRMETPQIFWMRVAAGLFVEEKTDRESWVMRLYTLYKSRRFCSSTPTLFNSGTLHSQLSSCYLYKVDDSIESIMYRGIAENAFLSKWAGGLGGSWTAVRGTGSYIKGTNGESQGVIPFLKLHNDLLFAVNQGGKRRGSGVAYLETWHNDIFDFLELRKSTGDERRRTHEMNTANWIPDLFMKRMEAREDWTLFQSNQVLDLHETYGKAFEQKYIAYERLAQEGKIYGKKIPAIELWKKMLSMLFETGHPWITFKDPCNVRSPQDHAGVIHSSNLCTEITLNTGADETAVCNLGSVILHTHLRADGTLDHEMLKETVLVAVRALDNVIDINFYPTDPARNANSRHRPVGLGVMGLQNALYKKGISFASEEAVEFNDEFMEAIAYYAYDASSDLAKERGTYKSYEGSKWSRGLLPQDTIDLLEQERGMQIDVPRGGKLNWDPLRKKIKKQGMRNSNVLSIAPTATISNIMGTVPCIEPTYKNLFVKSNLSGDFVVLNYDLVKDLKQEGLWNQETLDYLKYFDGELASIDSIPDVIKDKYKTAFGIDYEYIISAAARRQKWIDQSQSVNLFCGQPDLKKLSHMYRMAFHKGLKTTYYLRTLGASNIEKATISIKKQKRGLVASDEAATSAKKEYSEAEVKACSLEAMLNGGECEACQ